MRLVLDDNIVRSFGHGETSEAPFLALKEEGVSIHLADGAVAELLNQLLEHRFRWQNWLTARRILADILDPTEPVLLGGRQGLYRAGIRGATEHVTAAETALSLKRSSGWWHAFMRTQELSEVTLPVRVGSDILTLSPESTTREVTAFRTGWVHGFDTRRLGDELLSQAQQFLPRRGDGMDQLDAVARTIAKNLDKKNKRRDGVRPSIRLDAMIRVHVLLQFRSMRQIEPYNAQRNQNDSFDHDLLRYLAYPAAICTRDEGIARKMRAANCWQTRWIVHPNDLASSFGRQQIREMTWPADRGC
jgi:hypothetical protein